MTLAEIEERLGLCVLTSGEVGDREVTGGYTSDLLSDVMAHSCSGNIWITMQTHQNILAVAKLKDLAAVIVVNGRRPDADTLLKAGQEDMAILGTEESAFSISGGLYKLLEQP